MKDFDYIKMSDEGVKKNIFYFKFWKVSRIVLIFVNGDYTSPYTEHTTFLYFVKIFTNSLRKRSYKSFMKEAVNEGATTANLHI